MPKSISKQEYLKLCREISWLGVDFILRYNNPNWLGMSEVHKEIHNTIDRAWETIKEAKEGKRSWEDVKSIVLIHVHRGVGKTTQTLGRILWELGRNPNHKIKIVCETDDNARKRVIFLQQQILYNKHLHMLFPHLKPAESGLWNNLQLYVKRDIISVDPSIEGCGILSSSTGGRATLLFCLTSDTEVLTKEGWKLGTELSPDDEVLVYHPKTRQVFFEKPKAHIVYKKKEKVYEFRSAVGSYASTYNHKWLIKRDDELIVTTSENLAYKKHFLLPVSGERPYSTAPKSVLLKIDDVYRSFDLTDLLFFIGASLRAGIAEPGAIVFKYQNQEFIRRLENFCKKYKFRYISAPYTISIYSNFLIKFLYKLNVTNLFKELPFVLQASSTELYYFWEGFDYEGQIYSDSPLPISKETVKFQVRSWKKFIAFMQAIGVMSGVDVYCFKPIGTSPKYFAKARFFRSHKYRTFEEEKEGVYWCITTSTGFFIARRKQTVFITGNCDDPIGMKNAIIYPENAKKAEESFYSNWLPMLEDDGLVVIAYTVWTENDFPYKMEKSCNNCIKYIRLVDDDLNPVWPEKFPKEKLLEIKEKIGDTAFARGYQGRPGSSKDFLFDKETILASIDKQHPLGLPKDLKDSTFFIGVDLAISTKKSGKRTAIVVIQVDNEGNRHIIDIVAEKMSSIETASKIIQLAKKYKPAAIYVENNSYQQALIEWIGIIDTEHVTDGLVHGYYTGAQKFNPFTGLPALAGEFSKGKWKIHSTDHDYDSNCECPFCLAINEFITFPFGKTSDIVMATFFAREACKDILGEDAACDIKFLDLSGDFD